MKTIKVTTDDLLSVQQTASLLNRPRLTIYRWVDKGKITGIKLGGILFIPISQLTCSSCFHQQDGLCSCREPEDIPTNKLCPDWHPSK